MIAPDVVFLADEEPQGNTGRQPPLFWFFSLLF
jgi:hypothetical protein